jgi:hypothetical protein
MVDHQRLLQRCGEALYGPRWQSELARAVDISDRTMRRWVADPHEIPFGVWKDIQQLLFERMMEIERLRGQIGDAMRDAPD